MLYGRVGVALIVNDRVREQTTIGGTGAVTLIGAPTSFQTFSAGIGDGNEAHYTIVDNLLGDWEVGQGTYTASTNSLSRDTVFQSSNGDALVNFAQDRLKDVFCTIPAEDVPPALVQATTPTITHITGKLWYDTDDTGSLTDSITTVNITADYTVPSQASYNIFADCTNGDIDVTLFTASNNGNKRVNVIKVDTSGNLLTIETVNSETISGESAFATKVPDTSLTFISNNTNWFVE